MAHDPEKMRKKARSIVSGSKDAREAWNGLRAWASDSGHQAMEIAMHEFITSYGRDPASARLMPEMMHGMAAIRCGRREGPAQLPGNKVSGIEPALSLRPKSALALSPERPDALAPFGRLAEPCDHLSMRDMPLRMHEGIRGSLRLPMRSDGKERLQLKGMSAMPAGKSGEHIIKSLIQHISSHGRADVSGRKAKKSAPAARKKPPAGKTAKKKAGAARKKPPARKPVRKKAVKKTAGRKPLKRRSSRKR